MGKTYSLSDYIVSITPDNQKKEDSVLVEAFGTISIGGEGSYVGSIRASQTNDLFTTKGYPSGDWVHNKSMNRTGTVELTLNQLADKIGILINLVNSYFQADYSGCTIVVDSKEGKNVFTAKDCLPVKPADQEYGAEAADQTWTFTCGKVSFSV